jgi:hypothetical protein
MQRAIEGGDMGGAHAVHYPKKRQIWVAIPGKGGVPTTAFIMDYRFGYKGAPAWSVFEFQTSTWNDGGQRKRHGGFCTNEGGTMLYGVHTDGNGRPGYEQYDVADASDHQKGTPFGFRSRWESGPVGYNSNSSYRWRFIRPMIRPTMDATITGWWRHDEQPFDGGNDLNGQSVTFAPDDDSGGAALGAFVLNTDRLGGAEDHSKRLDVFAGGICRYGRIGFQTFAGAETGTRSNKFDIRSAEIDVLPRRKVRR